MTGAVGRCISFFIAALDRRARITIPLLVPITKLESLFSIFKNKAASTLPISYVLYIQRYLFYDAFRAEFGIGKLSTKEKMHSLGLDRSSKLNFYIDFRVTIYMSF